MNAPISRILVPVDFSPHSDFALSYAISLAGRLAASLHLLHVVEPISAAALGEGFYLPEVSELQARMVSDAEHRIAECRALAAAGNVPVGTDVLSGPAATIIASAASNKECDLIVMGTHGRTGLAHLFMGSVAERVTRLAPCSVLTVRETAWKKDSASSGKGVAAA